VQARVSEESPVAEGVPPVPRRARPSALAREERQMSRNRIVALLVLLAAATGAQVSRAGPPPLLGEDRVGPLYQTCVGYRYAGYARSDIPGSGQAASVNVNLQSASILSGTSVVAGWVGVDDQGSPRHWIQAGVTKNNTNGLIKYIEYNPTSGTYHFINKGAASTGTAYAASVTKVAAGSWTASIGGSSLGSNVSLSGMNTTQYEGESYVPTEGQCNAMVYYFSSSSPYGTSVMTKIDDPPYVVDSITSNGWHSHGPT
jgi:hypothetical protein